MRNSKRVLRKWRRNYLSTHLEHLEARLAPAQLFAVENGSTQRSNVRYLSATFDGLVTLNPGAIEVKQWGQNSVAVSLSQVDIAGKSTVKVQFPSTGTPNGSLDDGT